MKDVASYLGVSTSLVSFAINGKGKEHRISDEKIEQVKAAAIKLNYQPNIFAKSLREGKSKVIGVVLSDISNPFFSAIARKLENSAEEKGYSVLFCSSDEDGKRAEGQVANLINRGVDGLILVPCEDSYGFVRELAESTVPLVLLDRYFPGIEVSSVTLNNRQASREAVEHLFERGYRNPGMIAYDIDLQHMRDRTEGYLDAVKEHGLEGNIAKLRIKDKDFREKAKKEISRMVEEGVDSLLFATNNIATESLFAIRDLGISIPDGLGLIGFDGGSAFDFFYKPLSYIKQPVPDMAAEAVDILMQEIASGTRLGKRVEAEGRLVTNPSTNKS